jgi:AraC family transcriptional regulator
LGVSVGDYVRRLRLEWAANELATSELPLADVAIGAGFVDQSHFTRAFKRHTGVTPGRFRALLREK